MDLVLIISAKFNRPITEIVYRRGMIPLVYSEMELALYAARRTEFRLVIINAATNHIDVLEAALNVRDINKSIPILIAGLKPEDKQTSILRKLSGIVLVSKDQDDLSQKLKELYRR